MAVETWNAADPEPGYPGLSLVPLGSLMAPQCLTCTPYDKPLERINRPLAFTKPEVKNGFNYPLCCSQPTAML